MEINKIIADVLTYVVIILFLFVLWQYFRPMIKPKKGSKEEKELEVKP